MSRASRIYLLVVALLIAVSVVGGVRLAMQHSRSQPVEIVLSTSERLSYSGQLHIGGAVVTPSIYPWQETDSIQSLLLAAGLEADADLSRIRLYVPREGEAIVAQKIDINRAEPWLLQALPGIGEVRAQAIVGYRNEQGPFRRIEDLLKVSGVGPATFERMRDLITVSDQ
jgi:competence protein ComEA